MAEEDNNDDWVKGDASRKEDALGEDDKEEEEVDAVAEVVGVNGEYFFSLLFCPEKLAI